VSDKADFVEKWNMNSVWKKVRNKEFSVLVTLTLALSIIVYSVQASESARPGYEISLLIWADSRSKVDSLVVSTVKYNTLKKTRSYYSFDLKDKNLINFLWCDDSLKPIQAFPPPSGPFVRIENNQTIYAIMVPWANEVRFTREKNSCNCKSHLIALYCQGITHAPESSTPEEELNFNSRPVLNICCLWNQLTDEVIFVDSAIVKGPSDVLTFFNGFFDPTGTYFYYEKNGETWRFDALGKYNLRVSNNGYPAVAWNTGEVLVYSPEQKILTLLDSFYHPMSSLDGVDLEVPILSAYSIDDSCIVLAGYSSGINGMYSMTISVADFSKRSFETLFRAETAGQILSARKVQ
jgi:hypothetical protein